ncbi:M23 family metallopeptidase [Arthrobacter sp. EPSL27]|uniref:M23 family metallopeptidase n=1 Tax=Arthrobacter sp. EPSL27 TaxID=1745378 RepID=UPI0007468BB3|nr:M23 family metallopeptidase [Arthrobacter sp. EPSL27]KUM33235.1 hypothetical protein AR539_14835 [Arthrobacter sp. EPSL27]
MVFIAVIFVALGFEDAWFSVLPEPAAASIGPLGLTVKYAGEPPAAPPEAPPVMADPDGILSFERVDVDTIAADGTRKMTVASRALVRPSSGSLLAPLEVLRPSSPFGVRINSLSGAAGEFHWGQDFAARCGTRVYAADAGVARAVGWHPWGGGNRVEVDHGNGIITTYNHLESSTVQQGESVKVGEVIAHVGTTGSSTGCHLHFETISKGIHANPLNWTLLPVSQLDRLDDLPELDFEPGRGAQADLKPVWAVPMGDASKRSVTGGDHEAPVVKPPETDGPGPAGPASPAGPVDPTADLPVTPTDTPPVDPPVDPPADPPVDPPADPPMDPPADPPMKPADPEPDPAVSPPGPVKP